MSSDSCLIAQFERIIELTEAEKNLLQGLEENVREYPAETILTSQGERATNFFSLRSGWACASQIYKDGSRQVTDIFVGGQIMGLREVGLASAHTSIETVTDVVACPFPRNQLSEVFKQSHRLAILFFLIFAQNHALLTQRLANIGSKSAASRFAHFLLETRARLNVESSTFDLPLNQTVLGDALGMTSVHVSRVVGELKRKGLIDQEGAHLTILNVEGLIELGEFDPAYLEMRADSMLL